MATREQEKVLTPEEEAEMQKAMAKFKEDKMNKHREMLQKQSMSYGAKLAMAKERIFEFVDECDRRGLNCHVSVGGRDSIVLLALIRSLGFDEERIPAVGVSGLEDASIIRVHKEMGVIMLKPYKSKEKVIEEYGWPVASKKVTNKIAMLQNANENNATTRYAIITGECGKQGHYQKNSKMQLAKKWLELFGGWDPLGAELGYKHPNWLASDKCCYWLKEKPCDDWAKEHNSVPFLGLMASEGGRRAEALEEHGCNYFGKTVIRSCPFSPWFTSDVIRLGEELGVHIPEIYGETRYRFVEKEKMMTYLVPETGAIIEKRQKVTEKEYYSTGEMRTGCNICGFGIQMEHRPHRFDRLWQRSPRLWEKIMKSYARDLDGNLIGWGDVLDYIGIGWRNPWEQFETQTTLFDMINEDGTVKF